MGISLPQFSYRLNSLWLKNWRNTFAKTLGIITHSILTTAMLLVSHDDHREPCIETMLSRKAKPHGWWDFEAETSQFEQNAVANWKPKH